MAIRTLFRPLDEQSDEELVARCQGGDDQALATLLGRYRRFARSKSRSYFLMGADADDIEQEGLIGLYKAARDFQPERGVSFRAFAELCVTRQVISAVKAATRMKHQPLNRYVSISGGRPGDEDRGEALLDGHRAGDPAEEIIAHEQLDVLRATVRDALSGLEVEVLRMYLDGRSYQEIGARLGRHTKSIDNALQRIKRKLDLHLAEPATAAAA